MRKFAPQNAVGKASFNELKGFAFPGVENHFLIWSADLINHFCSSVYFWTLTIVQYKYEFCDYNNYCVHIKSPPPSISGYGKKSLPPLEVNFAITFTISFIFRHDKSALEKQVFCDYNNYFVFLKCAPAR